MSNFNLSATIFRVMRGIMGTQFQGCGMLFSWTAITISMLSSYTMFYFIDSMKRSDLWRKGCIYIAGSASVGLGITVSHLLIVDASGHFVMITWNLALQFIFCSTAVGFTYLLLGNDSRMWRVPRLRLLRIPIGGLLLTTAYGGIFVIEMWTANYRLVDINFVVMFIAFSLGYIGVVWSLYWFERHKGSGNLISSTILGGSISLLYIIGQAALTIENVNVLPKDRLDENLTMLTGVLGLGTLLILGSHLMTWFANQRLQFVHERYKLLVENSIDMIAISREGCWEYINRSGIRMFEADSADELIGKSLQAFLHPKHHCCMEKWLGANDPEELKGPQEKEWYTLKGNLLFTEVVVTTTTFNGRQSLQFIIRDISERKKNEELLINSEKLNIAGELAAGIAHEIRNPLTSLKGFLQLISSGRSASSDYFGIMKSELSRIETIVSELLMLSKPQAYDLNTMDIRKIVKDTIFLLEAQSNLHHILIEVQYGDKPLWIYGVEDQIKQVFVNVIKNAIEVMTSGGIIRVNCSLQHDHVKVRIQDEGPGIDEERLSKIGQPFYTTKDAGTGLGLMVSYKIVDNHDGHIQVESVVDHGTTFEITFPFTHVAMPTLRDTNKADS
ncbi:PAS domain S-box protein [Paenibacillaceae bacterium]|nr:PAS domain S-box protein [Paenibacillaceae bacterium]